MRMHPTRLAMAVVVLTLLLLIPSVAPTYAADLDYDIPGGHFYQQANGQGGGGATGFAVTNADGIAFWDEYQRLGGPDALGYPVSRRFQWNGFTCQAMQKVIFQWRPESRTVAFVNVLDQMHLQGLDGWLWSVRQTPAPFDASADSGLAWPAVADRHWAFLDTNLAIRARYWADPAPLDHFGLPVSYADTGNAFVIRCQRAIFQQWKEDVPWARAGQVTVANAGDLAKEAGMLPSEASAPEPGPAGSASPPTPVTHDWRTPGFVAAVGGQLYDARCVPLRSVGANVPNLAYGGNIGRTLEWMRQHHIRWIRVIATGHALTPDRAPRDAAAAVAALGALLAQVEAFNAAHDPAESIYILVALTDYYPPGVPGDRYAFDHPTFSLSAALPAPWFRAGVNQFDFDQEHNAGLASGLPNYEVNYKPWVRQIVSSLSGNPALMGWQLGSEIKARGSPRNGISSAQAYEWYRGFTRDIVDTIRAADRNHLIFTGAQYMAELVDWEYRPRGTPLEERIAHYRQLVQQMLDVGGQYTWNVWGLTMYDFNPYPLDDAATFGQADVATVATEYGFTRGTPAEMAEWFGGDRAAAVRAGIGRPWTELGGRVQPRSWSVSELMANGPLAGIAPWGAPAPGPGAELDTDGARGITGTPDEAELWSAWGDVAATLESGNRSAGVCQSCLAYRSGP